MATTGHESETINVGGLKTTLQKFKTDFVDDSVNTRIENAIKALDSTKSQTAGTDGLALSITETDGKITSISGSISSGTYDIAGSASTAKTEVIGGATTNGNTLKKLEDRVLPLESAIGSGGSIDTRIENAINVLDSTKTQSAGTDGLALSITQTDGKIASISGSIASDTYDAYGSASAESTRAQNVESNLLSEIQSFYSQLNSRKADKATTLAGYNISDAYTKGAVNNMISALTQGNLIVGSKPSIGSANTIYRVPNTNYYEDWMYYGGSWIKLATYSGGIDIYPTINSDNFVLSKGLFEKLKNFSYEIYENFKSFGKIYPRNYELLKSNGDTELFSDDIYDTSDYIDLSNFEIIEYQNIIGDMNNKWKGLILYDENKTKISSYNHVNNSGIIELSEYPTAKYLRYSTNVNLVSQGNTYVIIHSRYNTSNIFKKNIPEIGRIYPRNYELLKNDGTTDILDKDLYDTSDYINISGTKVIDFYNVFPGYSNYVGLVLYDSSKNAIQSFTGSGSIILKNYPNAIWMRYSVSINNINCSIRIKGIKDDEDIYSNQIIVNVGPNRTYTTIQAAVNSITDASNFNRYTILVDEGDYDISNAGIVCIRIKPYVNIIGVSKKCRIIQRISSYNSGYNAFENIAGFSGEAEIANFTIITEKSKGALHLDSNNWTGQIYFHDCDCQVIENEEPYDPTADYFKAMAASHGAVNLATWQNQKIIIENIQTNGYIYSHTEYNGSNNLNSFPSQFVVKNCVCDWIGVYANGDKVRKTAIIENNRCNYIKISFSDHFNLGYMAWNNIILNNNRCSFVQGQYKPYNAASADHNLWDEYYNKQMVCPDKSLHTSVQNLTGSTIARGTKVNFTDYRHRYIEVASDPDSFDAITVHTIENNQFGVVQDGGDLNIFWTYIQSHPYEKNS